MIKLHAGLSRSLGSLSLCMLAILVGCGNEASGLEGLPDETQAPIIGGESEPSAFPQVGCLWVGAASSKTNRCNCTGTLISKHFVISAKHCGAATYFAVGSRLGSFSFIPIDYQTSYYPSESNINAHDIQLLHVTPPTNFFVRPASINTAPLPGVGQTCIGVGYGQTSTGQFGYRQSGSVVVDYTGPDSQSFQLSDTVKVHAAPAGATPPGGLPSFGDSGGPLFCNDRIVGTATGFYNNDTSHFYFTAVDTLAASWITDMTADDVNEPLVSAITGGPNVKDLFVRGADGQVWHKWSTGSSWGPSQFGWQALGGYITGTPEAVTWGGNHIDVFARGGDSNPATDSPANDTLWDLSWNGSSWGWLQLAGGPYAFIGHPSAVSFSTSRVDVFAVGTDGAVWHNRQDNKNGFGWGWVSLGQPSSSVTFTGAVKAAVPNTNMAAVFANGSDNALWYIIVGLIYVQEGPNLVPIEVSGSWQSLGGIVVGSPSVAVWGPNRMDVFVKSPNNAAYHKAYDTSLPLNSDGTYWYPSQAGWEFLGGSMIAAPVATSFRFNQLTILAPNTNTATEGLDYKAWFGNGWVPSTTTWLALGTVPVGTPTLLPFPTASTVDAYTLGTNFTPYLMQYSTTGPSASYGWYAPGSLGGVASPW